MEFYFSDSNINKDRFLAQLIHADPYVDLSIFLKFNKIRTLTTNIEDICKALRKSEKLQLSEDNLKVCRVTPIQEKTNQDECTIYVERVPAEVEHDWLKNIFSKFGTVDYVSIPKYKHNKMIKGFAFIEFSKPDEAQKVLEYFESIGCKLPTKMPPDQLISIVTFESDNSEKDIHSLSKCTANEKQDAVDDEVESKTDDISTTADNEAHKKSEKLLEESDKKSEVDKSKKRKISESDDTEVSKKTKNENEDATNEEVANNEGENGNDEEESIDKKKRKRKKSHKKSTVDIKQIGLKVLSKREWKQLRNNESLDWLFDNKETNLILTWLCTYVNDSNVITSTEQYEFDILQKDGTEFSDENIDEAISRLNTTHSSIFEINANQINALKKDWEIEKQRTEKSQNLVFKYQTLESKIADQLNKLVAEEIDTRVQRHSALSEYEAKCKKLDEIHNNTYLNIHKYIKTSPKNNSFNNYKLNIYKQQSECFNTNFDLWMKKSFIEESCFADVDYINKEFHRLKYVIEESILNNVKIECTEKELRSKIQYVRSNTFTELSEEQQREQKIQLTCRIHSQYEDLERLYATELPQAVQQYTQNMINCVLLKNAERKLIKCKDKLRVIKYMNREATHALAQCHLVNLLLKTDKTKIHAVDNFLDDTYFYITKYNKHYSVRLEYLTKIGNKEPPKENPIISDIVSLLTENDMKDSITVNQALIELEKRNAGIEKFENNIFQANNQLYLDKLKDLQLEFQKIKQYISDGPTIQPVIFPWGYLQSLSNVNLCLNKVNKVSRTCLDNYKRTLSLLEKNRWLKCKHLLWIWFIANPDRLITTIQQLRDFVNEQARTNS
ncbi:La related protein 7 [Carabus blaptoides fortunei]